MKHKTLLKIVAIIVLLFIALMALVFGAGISSIFIWLPLVSAVALFNTIGPKLGRKKKPKNENPWLFSLFWSLK